MDLDIQDRANALAARLVARLGSEHVLTGDDDRDFYARDLSFRPYQPAAIVIQPGTIDELAEAVGIANAAGFAVVPRGGGMSYTQGYTPQQRDAVLVDMRRLNRIVEINAEDMYVIAECGCTWQQLHAALAPLGLRTPYWGPLSGAFATVGGAISQNSSGHGTGTGGMVVDSVLGLRVVLAGGEVVTTGSWGRIGANPFWRNFGPDMTGIFTADTGALGLKAAAVLKLVKIQPHTGYLSYKFEKMSQMFTAQTHVARLEVATECYGLDPYYNEGFEKQGVSLEAGVSILGKVIRKGGVGGLTDAARLAMGGRRILRGAAYSLHFSFDGHSEAIVDAIAKLIDGICASQGGVEISNAIPMVFRTTPFDHVRSILVGSEGEVWMPIHGWFPLGKAIEVGEATEAFFVKHQALMDQWGIRKSYLTGLSKTMIGIEPSLYWRDALGPNRLSRLAPEDAAAWGAIPANEGARDAALMLRDGLRDLYNSMGGMNLQIGRYYPFTSVMNNAPLERMVRGVKQLLDPEGLINPGCLGL